MRRLKVLRYDSQFYKNGGLALNTVYINGVWYNETRYCGNGTLSCRYTKHTDHIDECYFHENGNLWIKRTYVNYCMHGTECYFHENGMIKSMRTYVNGKLDADEYLFKEDGSVKK